MTGRFIYNEVFKSQFPDEWLLIGNPEYNGSILVGGAVLYHSKDKREVCYIGKDKTSEYNRIALIYNGNVQSHRKNGILRKL